MAATALRRDASPSETLQSETTEELRRDITPGYRAHRTASAGSRPAMRATSRSAAATSRATGSRAVSRTATANAAAAVPRVAPSPLAPGRTAPRPGRAPVPAHPRTAPRTQPRVTPRESDDALESDEHLVAARRRVRRGHRSSGLPGVPALAAVVLLGQVALLLYVNSLGLAATHAATDLDQRIAATTEEIKQSQRRISSATSTSQLESWAARLNLRRVQQSDIDRVDEAARPADMAAAVDAASPSPINNVSEGAAP